MQVNVADMYTNPTILHCCRCPSLLWPSPFWDGVPMSSDLHCYTQCLSRGICMCVYDWGSTISLTWCSWTKWQGATWGTGRSCACIWPFTWLTSMQDVTADRQQSLFFIPFPHWSVDTADCKGLLEQWKTTINFWLSFCLSTVSYFCTLLYKIEKKIADNVNCY